MLSQCLTMHIFNLFDKIKPLWTNYFNRENFTYYLLSIVSHDISHSTWIFDMAYDSILYKLGNRLIFAYKKAAFNLMSLEWNRHRQKNSTIRLDFNKQFFESLQAGNIIRTKIPASLVCIDTNEYDIYLFCIDETYASLEMVWLSLRDMCPSFKHLYNFFSRVSSQISDSAYLLVVYSTWYFIVSPFQNQKSIPISRVFWCCYLCMLTYTIYVCFQSSIRYHICYISKEWLWFINGKNNDKLSVNAVVDAVCLLPDNNNNNCELNIQVKVREKKRIKWNEYNMICLFGSPSFQAQMLK